MRRNYEVHGVKGYYSSFGSSYKNPHDAPLRKALSLALNKWTLEHSSLSFQWTLDLACGSGESTLALERWCREQKVPDHLVFIEGADPYTHEAYCKRVGRPAEKFSFKDIQDGHLEGRRYSLVISSFALHLLEDKSQLWATLMQLSFVARHLIVLTPHKRPEIQDKMGFRMCDEVRAERIRVRLYESTNFFGPVMLPVGRGKKDCNNKSGLKSSKDANHAQKKDIVANTPQTKHHHVQHRAGAEAHCNEVSTSSVFEDTRQCASSLSQRLTTFWLKHAPKKLPNVKRVLAKYNGHEDVLIARLEKKYGAPFPSSKSEPHAEFAKISTSVDASEKKSGPQKSKDEHGKTDSANQQGEADAAPSPDQSLINKKCTETSISRVGCNIGSLKNPLISTSKSSSIGPPSNIQARRKGAKSNLRDALPAAPGCTHLNVVTKVHKMLYPPNNSTTTAHALSDAERTKSQSLAVKSLTYGEIQIDSFYQLLCGHVIGKHALNTPWFQKMSKYDQINPEASTDTGAAPISSLPSFMDFGSGSGAAVFAAALCYPFRCCSGVEILHSLHGRAMKALECWHTNALFRKHLPSFCKDTTINLQCGDLATTTIEISDINIGFANSTLFDANLMQRLAQTVGHMCKHSLFVSFSKDLPCATWEVVERYQAMMSWGVCIVIVQRKIAAGYVPSTDGKFYSNRDDHTYAPDGDPKAFLNSIKIAVSRDADNRLSPKDFASIAENTSALHNIAAKVWPSSTSTQIKVVQKLRKSGVRTVQDLKEQLGIFAISPSANSIDVDAATIPVNRTLRERGHRTFNIKTLQRMAAAIRMASESHRL